MGKLYFYKLRSPYAEDVTKNCKLNIEDIDENNLHLKDADIKGAYLKGTDIILERNDGSVITIDASSLSDRFKVTYDKSKGEIEFIQDGDTTTVDGIVTRENIDEVLRNNHNGGIFTDATLNGDGRQRRPLGISPVELTGMLKPAIRIIDTIESSEKLPERDNLKRGDRFVTREEINPYGLLYNFKGVHAIMHDLNHDWRIPSKPDWDDMLNAIEPCDEYRNHGEKIGNHILGKYAGKMLKSNGGEWEDAETDNPFDWDGEHQYPHGPGKPTHRPKPKPKIIDAAGTDSYGFTIIPAGYGDGGELRGYFGSRAAFWTSTMDSVTDVYIKRFDSNKSGVVQTIDNPNALFSLRLVKDFDGHNFTGVEFINGMSYRTVLMPSLDSPSGFRIWVGDNVAFSDPKYGGVPPLDENVDLEAAYFINEWDGFKWFKRRIQEGEQVVVFDEDYAQYMLKNGVLELSSVGAGDVVSKKDLDEVSENVEAIKEQIKDLETQADADTKYTELLDKIQENQSEIKDLDGLVKTMTGIDTARIKDIEDAIIDGATYNQSTGTLSLVRRDGKTVDVVISSNYGEMEP